MYNQNYQLVFKTPYTINSNETSSDSANSNKLQLGVMHMSKHVVSNYDKTASRAVGHTNF